MLIRKLKLIIAQIKVIWLIIISKNLDLAWCEEPDKAAGASVKSLAVELGLQFSDSGEPALLRSVPLPLIALCHRLNRDNMTLTFSNVSYKDTPIGDWSIEIMKKLAQEEK